MRKKTTLLVALLLVISCIMATMAYNIANVSDPTALSISSTDNALLAISPATTGGGSNDRTARIENGILKFYPGWSGLSGWAGLQPGSSYYWTPIVKITNNSANDVWVRVDNGVTGLPTNAPFAFSLYTTNQYGAAFVTGTDKYLVQNNEGYWKDTTKKVRVNAGASIYITLRITTWDGGSTFTPNIQNLGIVFDAVATDNATAY